MNWFIRHAGTAYPNPLKFEEDVRGFHNQQTDVTLRAIDTKTGQVVGYIDYCIYDGRIYIQMIEVNPKRQYIGTQMFNKLKADNPQYPITRSLATEEGSSFRNSIDPVKPLEPKDIVALALKVRQGFDIHDRAIFGDCKDVATSLQRELEDREVLCRLAGGEFVTNRSDDSRFDHTWLIFDDGSLLDPTIDQFYSDLDVDMVLRQPGVYFSHPQWDGDWLVDRYE